MLEILLTNKRKLIKPASQIITNSGSVPAPRSLSSLATDGTKLYTAGGSLNGSASIAEFYSVTTNGVWMKHADMPDTRANVPLVYLPVRNQLLQIMGSSRRHFNVTTLPGVTHARQEITSPEAIHESSCIVHNNTLYIFGGKLANDSTLNTLYTWSSGTTMALQTQYGSLPEARKGHGCCLGNDKMYVVGGYRFGVYDGTMNTFLNDFYVMDIPTRTWTRLPDFPYRIAQFTMFHHGNAVYVVGGWLENDYSNRIFGFNLLTNEWEDLGTFNGAPRRGFGGAFLNGHFYIFGGSRAASTEINNELVRITPFS